MRATTVKASVIWLSDIVVTAAAYFSLYVFDVVMSTFNLKSMKNFL